MVKFYMGKSLLISAAVLSLMLSVVINLNVKSSVTDFFINTLLFASILFGIGILKIQRPWIKEKDTVKIIVIAYLCALLLFILFFWIYPMFT